MEPASNSNHHVQWSSPIEEVNQAATEQVEPATQEETTRVGSPPSVIIEEAERVLPYSIPTPPSELDPQQREIWRVASLLSGVKVLYQERNPDAPPISTSQSRQSDPEPTTSTQPSGMMTIRERAELEYGPSLTTPPNPSSENQSTSSEHSDIAIPSDSEDHGEH